MAGFAGQVIASVDWKWIPTEADIRRFGMAEMTVEITSLVCRILFRLPGRRRVLSGDYIVIL